MYENNDFYLYEMIEDYKESLSQEKKDDIFKSFCSSIWCSDNKRQTYMKAICFHVNKHLSDTDLGRVFEVWSNIEYRYYKTVTNDEKWSSLIRQKINNIYTKYFDKEVILGKEYLELIKTPKRLYYNWASGIPMEKDAVIMTINDAIEKSVEVKTKLQMEKMTLSWNKYKSLVETFLRRCLDNCKLIEKFESVNMLSTHLDCLTEDHFYVKYICRCLDGEIRKWQKCYYKLPQTTRKGYARCSDCHNLYIYSSPNQRRCKECQPIYNRKNKTEKQKKYRVEKLKSN